MLKMTKSSDFLRKKLNNFFSSLVEFYKISHLSMSYGDLIDDRKGKL